jgi:hypothetical protein
MNSPAPAPYATNQEMGIPTAGVNAFTVMMPPPGNQGWPDGEGNAFTRPSTTRPVPADYGRSYQIPNAFPTPPQQMPYPVTPAGYSPYGAALLPPGAAPVVNPAWPLQSSGVQTAHLLAVLRGSALPSEREVAADYLSRCDWRFDPNVVTGLVQAAHSDPAPAVRASCVRALGRMKVNTVPVVSAVMALKSDRDVRVRQEVEQALAVMAAP